MDVAVCLSGWVNVNVVLAGRTLRLNLIDPLGADVFVAGTYLQSECTAEQCELFHQQLHGLEPITLKSLRPMVTTPELLRSMQALPPWPRVLAVSATQYRYRNLSIFTPVLGNPQANVLREFFDYQQVLNLLTQHEQTTRARYARVVFSRLEMDWAAPHPPLHLLAPQLLWLPWSNSRYAYGLNDRHAVMAREHAEVYLGRWRLLHTHLTPEGLRMGPGRSNLIPMRALAYVGPEVFLKLLLVAANISFGFFSPLGFVSCCGLAVRRGGTCWQYALCRKALIGNRTAGARYPDELNMAIHDATLLRECPGAALQPKLFLDGTRGPRGASGLLQLVISADSLGDEHAWLNRTHIRVQTSPLLVIRNSTSTTTPLMSTQQMSS